MNNNEKDKAMNNKVQILGAAVLSLASVFGLSACNSGTEDTSRVDIDEVASYSIGHGNRVAEFRSVSNPDNIVVAVEGYKASGSATWKQPSSADTISEPEVLADYKTSAGDVTEFRPASNPDKLCTYISVYKSGSLTCTDMSPR